MIKMPPQAYTKEVLAAAFDWLSNQPEYVRQKIASSDDLVGLYLKSTRLKTDFNKDLTSAKNFRNELQDLAQNLKQFEEKEERSVSDRGLSRTMNLPPQKEETESQHFRSSQVQESASRAGFDMQNLDEENIEGVSPSAPQAAAPRFQFNPQNIESLDSTPVQVKTSKPSITATAPATKPTKLSEGEIIFKLDQKTLSALNLAKDRLNLSSDTEALRVLVSLGEKHLKKLFSTED